MPHSLRSIRKNPGLPAIVITVLALGIGANTALFSILDRVLLHPFPFRDLDRLVQIRGLSDKGRSVGIAPAEFEYLQPRVPSLDLIALWRWESPLLTAVPDPQNVFGHEVGPDLFEMLGVAPALGRTFHAGDLQPS